MSEDYPQRTAIIELMGEDDFDVKLMRSSTLLNEAMYTASELGVFGDMSLTRSDALAIYKLVSGCLKQEKGFKVKEAIAKVRM